MSRIAVLSALALVSSALLGLLLSSCSSISRCSPVPHDSERPNIVLILTDDEDRLATPHMPNLQRYFVAEGATFENAFVTQALCCPSRTSIILGQYPHNHGIISNDGPSGGYATFFDQGKEDSTIATWLQEAGYRTGYVGKYLNGFGSERWHHNHIPPGWDEWFVNLRYTDDDYGYFNNRFNDNGRPVRFGRAARDYRTDIEARRAIQFIERSACEADPFFLMVAPFAPHAPYTPAPRHADRFADLTLPRTPDFNESDISDKPRKNLPRLTPEEIETIDEAYRNRLRAMLAVDDLIGDTVAALERLQRLEHTVLIYMSDHGYHMGHHRLRTANGNLFGKNHAYETDIRIPLLMRGPGLAPGTVIEEMVLNNDIAPTLAAWGGATPTSPIDGRSLLPLLDGDPLQPADWRRAFAVERWELDDAGEIVPTFLAVRTERYKYIVWGIDGRVTELYDLENDPFELDNLVRTADPDLLGELHDRLSILITCAATGCIAAESAP